MKIKLLFGFFTLLFFFTAKAQQEVLPTLECAAPIDPSWLKHIKKEALVSKALDEPTVRVAYLIPSNRTAQAKGVEALQLVVTAGRDFFKKEMAYNGLSAKTFRYETEADGETPLIHVVNIPETDAEIEGQNGSDAWRNKINAARNAGLSIWQRGEIWILVSESHVQLADGSIVAGGALGGSSGSADDPGVATMTSTFLTPLAEGALTDDRVYGGMLIPEIGPYPLKQNISFHPGNRSTMSSIASVTIGAFWHELMHAFGIIPHDFRNDASFHGNLMGNGFRGVRGHLYPNRYPNDYTRLAFVSAQVLNTSHYFNSGKQRNQVDVATVSLRSRKLQDGQLVVHVTASDADGLSLLRMIGFPDYNSVEMVLSGNSFNGQIATPYFEHGTTRPQRIILYDKQGNKVERVINTSPQRGNRAPLPFLRFYPSIGDSQETFLLEGIRSRDPDGNYPLSYEWDFDNDGFFDTPPSIEAQTYADFPGGDHLIRLRVTDSNGNHTISTPVALHVDGDAPPPTEVSFTLVDATTGLAVPGFDPMQDEAILDRSSLPPKLSIRANVPDHYESVRFDYQNTFGFNIENKVPYALFGDDKGIYVPGTLVPGDHSLVATPFSKNGAKGASGTKAIIRFSVVESHPSFTLIDASTNQPVPGFDPIPDGAQLDPQALPPKLNIRANVPAHYESARFDFDGKESFRLENVSPYALFGDNNGNFKSGTFSLGPHTLSVTPFTENEAQGLSGATTTISFYLGLEILGFEYSSEIYNFEQFFPLTDEAFFSNLIEGPRPFAAPVTIKAITNPSEVGSVKIAIERQVGFTHSRIENLAPYTLFGDSNGVFNSRLLSHVERIIPNGIFEVTATAYSEPNGKGVAGKPLTISFLIHFEVDIALNEVRVFNPETEAIISYIIYDMDIDENVVIDKNLTPTDHVNIVAEYYCSIARFCPESVRFVLKGPVNKTKVENGEPFSLFGDNDSTGAFFGRFLPVGKYSLKITGYSEKNARGFIADEMTLGFEIIKGGAVFLETAGTKLYPNPASNITTLKTDDSISTYKGVIRDLAGRVVMELPPGFGSEQNIDISRLRKGIYIIQIQSEKENVTKKLVVH